MGKKCHFFLFTRSLFSDKGNPSWKTCPCSIGFNLRLAKHLTNGGYSNGPIALAEMMVKLFQYSTNSGIKARSNRIQGIESVVNNARHKRIDFA